MPSAADYINRERFDFRKANYLKNNFSGSTAPTDPAIGTRWHNSTTGKLDVWNGSAWVSCAGSATDFPVGAILFWLPGYFAAAGNVGIVPVLSLNTVAAANAYLNSLGWYVCNGAAVNVPGSLVWNAASRYLPNLTDSRFIMGSTAAGATGGSNTMDHTHTMTWGTITSGQAVPTETAMNTGGYTCMVAAHTHTLAPDPSTSGLTSDTENRPLYLSGFYIVRVA